jgi:hypothetical protein
MTNTTPPTKSKLQQLLDKEAQLKARIQQEKARISQQERKQRTGRLIAWGVVIEQMLKEEVMTPETWSQKCHQYLTGRTLERALTGDWHSSAEQETPPTPYSDKDLNSKE